MLCHSWHTTTLVSCTAFWLAGCGVPRFDIPNYQGAPTVAVIVSRVRCELTDLVKPGAYTREELLGNNYEVGVQLYLDVNNSGELAPSFNFPQTPTLAYNLGAKLAKSREQNFTLNLYYSMNQLAADWDQAVRDAKAEGKNEPDVYGKCPSPLVTNLAGQLGIKESAELAFTSPDRNPTQGLSGTSGQFGGFVSFVVTKNLNAVGPTWTLQHFKGPGNLGTLSSVNTDKITFGFAPGKVKEVFKGEVTSDRVKALLLQLNLNQIQAR